MAYEVTWLVSDKAAQFEFDPKVYIEGQKIPHAFLFEALWESSERVPTRAKEITRAKEVFDFVSVSARLCVSEDLHSLIEAYEPSVHQFFPIELTRQNGEKAIKRFFLLNVMTKLDARAGVGQTLRREAVVGHHLWHAPRATLFFFMSDELVGDIKSRGLTGLQYRKLEEM
jgi:hypothetical protein